MQQEKIEKTGRTESQKVILLIEDHPIFRQIIELIIHAQTPHRVVHLTDGAQILEAIKTHQPDLLILDYELPGKNGIELYDLVHETADWQHLPTIIVSAELPQQQIVQRNIVGLLKPYRSQDLVQAIETALA